MNEDQVKNKMGEVLNLVASDIGSIRTGRATSSLVEEIEVLAYGGQQKLKIKELASVTVSDPQTLIVDPWDKSIIGEIKQGILAANVGFNPSIDGQIIRIVISPMTTEDREKYAKILSTKLESGKIMIRQIRGDTLKAIKRQFEGKEITEDRKFAQEKKLQEITDEFTVKIEKMGEVKKQEILQI